MLEMVKRQNQSEEEVANELENIITKIDHQIKTEKFANRLVLMISAKMLELEM